MSDLSVQLTAPNGLTYTQPTGLFINGEFCKAAKGGTITSIDPAFVPPLPYPQLGPQLGATLYPASLNPAANAIDPSTGPRSPS